MESSSIEGWCVQVSLSLPVSGAVKDGEGESSQWEERCKEEEGKPETPKVPSDQQLPAQVEKEDQHPPAQAEKEDQHPPAQVDRDREVKHPPAKRERNDQHTPVRGEREDQHPPARMKGEDHHPLTQGERGNQHPPVRGESGGEGKQVPSGYGHPSQAYDIGRQAAYRYVCVYVQHDMLLTRCVCVCVCVNALRCFTSIA